MTDACIPTPTHAHDASAAIATTLKALAHPVRVSIVSAISRDPRGESCVCDLETVADLSQPTISHHLKVMREAGVLESERRGTWVYYRITPELRGAVSSLLSAFATPQQEHPSPSSDSETS